MGNIKQMSTKLANMIAAGEVVERPLNIVKELVENSIDAASSKISISLKNGGLEEIKVSDNGCGMDESDIKMCFLPHATSKLLNEFDLFRIKTLGFRGEALASIASVSEVSLTSKTANSEAYNIVYRFGKPKSFSKTASEVGTSISVKNLFYNTPARLKYLKTNTQELAAISALVDKLALSSPNISFTLTNDNKLLFKTDGKNNMTSLIGQIYGLEASKRLVKLSFNEYGFSCLVYYVKPEIYRSNKNQMTYIINKRYVRFYQLNDVVLEAFKGYLPINKYPILVMYLDIDPLLIDVNIHPKKEEVKIAEPAKLFHLIYKVLKESLSSLKDIKEINYEPSYAQNNNAISYTETLTSGISDDLSYNLFDVLKDNTKEYSLFETSGSKLPNLSFIGIFLKTYIICEAGTNLYLLDQHACAERIRYEYFQKELNNPKLITTSLLVPLILEFTKEELYYLKDNLATYQKLGFDLLVTRDNKVKVNSIPVWATKEVEDIVREILKCITSNKDINIIDFRDEVCKQISCKASIRANDSINKEEALDLIRQLNLCENPYHCPHGRPTIIKFSKKELERLFERIEG